MRLKELIKRDVVYKEPNWDKGWEEAQRYEEFRSQIECLISLLMVPFF